METVKKLTEPEVWDLLNAIPDPEVPVISIVELGVVRGVDVGDTSILITMTPTYSGCPALKMMEEEIRKALADNTAEVKIKMVFKPAWTTDWLSEATKKKMQDYGIAPPEGTSADNANPFLSLKTVAKCPFCKSDDTRLTSQFGSTACKALYYCNSCQQPFEHFKCH